MESIQTQEINLMNTKLRNTGIVTETKQTKKISFEGKADILKVYKIRLDQLYYNDKNDRIATYVNKYQIEHGIDRFDFSDLKKYNKIIEEGIRQSNPSEYENTKQNIKVNGQQEPGIVLKDGRVIDGNRRFTCLRDLSEESETYNYFYAVILDRNYDDSEKSIKLLELWFQQGLEARVDYGPIERLVGVYRDIEKNHLLTVKEYANITSTKLSTVKKDLEIAKLMVEFLEFIKCPEQFYIAKELSLDGPIRELNLILKRYKDDKIKQNKVKFTGFTYIFMPSKKDKTRLIRGMKEIVESDLFENEFLPEVQDIGIEIVDKINSEKKSNKLPTTEIINKVKSDVELKTTLDKSYQKADQKTKIANLKSKPMELLDDALKNIDGLDKLILGRLKAEQKKEIAKSCNAIQAKLSEIMQIVND
jgi:ParB-like chromosome segregation protein Spo0J